MRKPVRVTVTGGKCSDNLHEVGQVFAVDETTPGGLCLGVWNAIAPYLTALRYGGNFPWEDEEGVATIGCPDPDGITVELRRIEREDM